MLNDKCSHESGEHEFESNGAKVYCIHCGEPYEHKHELERSSDGSDLHVDRYECANKKCEYTEEEPIDCQP